MAEGFNNKGARKWGGGSNNGSSGAAAAAPRTGGASAAAGKKPKLPRVYENTKKDGSGDKYLKFTVNKEFLEGISEGTSILFFPNKYRDTDGAGENVPLYDVVIGRPRESVQ